MNAVENGEIIERSSWRRSICYLAGDRVRIFHGPLVGLTGVVMEVNAEEMCVLIVDGLAEGIFCIAPQSVLERSEAPMLGLEPSSHY